MGTPSPSSSPSSSTAEPGGGRWRHHLERAIPLLASIRRADAGSRRADLIAGLTVAAMLIPQGMAYAALAGMPPVTGLYASTVPLVAYALLGSSGQLAFGPVAIVSLLTASTLAPLADGDPGRYVVLAGMLAVLVGAIQVLLGVLRAGRLTGLLSHAVISGFTSAAAIVIATSQVDKLLGVEIARPDGWLARITALAGAVPELHLPTVIFGVVVIALLVLGRRLPRTVPTPLLVVGLATAVAAFTSLPAAGVSVIGEVPSGFPAPTLPAAPLGDVMALLPGALIIALLSYLEGISVARAIASRTRERIRPDRELLAAGTANLAAGVFQAFPVAGGFSRTAVNHTAGARTPLAGLVAAAGVSLALLVLAPLFTTLPEVVLAGVVLVAVAKLVDVGEAVHAWRVERTDGVAWTVTFVATLLLGVELGIGVGIAASLLLSLWRVGLVRVREDREAATGTLVLRVEGDLLPASSVTLQEEVEDRLAAPGGTEVARLVLDLSGVPSTDLSGVHALEAVDGACRAAGVELRLVGVRAGVREPLGRSGALERFGERWQGVAGGSGPELHEVAGVVDVTPPAVTAERGAHVGADPAR